MTAGADEWSAQAAMTGDGMGGGPCKTEATQPWRPLGEKGMAAAGTSPGGGGGSPLWSPLGVGRDVVNEYHQPVDGSDLPGSTRQVRWYYY